MFRFPMSRFELLTAARKHNFRLEADYYQAREEVAKTTAQRNLELIKGIGFSSLAVAGAQLYDDAQGFLANSPIENVDGYLMTMGIGLVGLQSILQFVHAGLSQSVIRVYGKKIKSQVALGETLTRLGELPTPDWITKEQ